MSNYSFLRFALMIVIVTLFGSGNCEEIIRVPADYPTIQEAIDASSDGDVVMVSPGTYYEGIEFKGKNILLRSEDPTSPTVVENTIITWQEDTPDYYIVTFDGTETSDCLLSGFTITHGRRHTYSGIRGNGCHATISHNRIIDNGGDKEHGEYGGGIYDCDGYILANIISDNMAATDGGGLYDCEGSIVANVISGNQANRYFGGGLVFCHGVIQNNEITDNSCGERGGGISICNGVIRDNIINNNEADLGGAIYGGSSAILYNTIENNRSYDYGGALSNCAGLVKGNTISGNEGTLEGGAFYQCSALITDNVITNNTANKGAAFTRNTGDIVNNEIRGNYGDRGGAFYADASRIAFNTIAENSAEKSGGAFYRLYGAVVENNVIEWNMCKQDGGAFYDCDDPIRNNIIAYNLSENKGGAFYECNGEIQNNIIHENIGVFGGAFGNCSGDIKNNVIYYNAATAGGGFYECQADIQNCIIWANSAHIGDQLYITDNPTYSCIQDWLAVGSNNIGLDPMFMNSTNNDFHLKTSSPCIDAGNPMSEYNDALLPPGLGTVQNDMGAYGGPYNKGWLQGIPSGALAELSPGGALNIAENEGAPPFTDPELLGMTGFSFQPENGWLAQDGDFNFDGYDDLVQVTEHGDAWVYTQPETLYSPTRWGWLGYSYRETVSDNGDIPIVGDVDGDGADDLIQITRFTDVWVALSSETSFYEPMRFGWLGYRFKRGDETTKGELPLTGDTDGDGMDDLIQITEYGDAWVALSMNHSYDSPTRWGWLGFSYQPAAAWLPMTGDFNGDGMDDLVQFTPFGDPWVALSDGSSFMTPTRWGWLNFVYYEPNGSYPLTGDVNLDGQTDLIQIKADGSAWVAYSKGDAFETPEYWGDPGFTFSRQNGNLPFYLKY